MKLQRSNVFFLQDKMQDAVAAAELAYNIVEALRLYADNSDCRLLSAMLAGDVRPFIWADQNSLIEKIRVRCYHIFHFLAFIAPIIPGLAIRISMHCVN